MYYIVFVSLFAVVFFKPYTVEAFTDLAPTYTNEASQLEQSFLKYVALLCSFQDRDLHHNNKFVSGKTSASQGGERSLLCSPRR